MRTQTSNDFPMAADAPLADFAIEERPAPTPGPDEALIRITAAAVNPLDVRTQAGLFPLSVPAPIVLGNEGSGVVEQSRRFAPGTRVMIMGFPLGVSADGTHRELMTVPEDWLVPMPENWTFEEGASCLVAYATAEVALTYSASVAENDFVVVTGAAGGIGRAAVQLATAHGAKTIAIVSSREKAESLGEEGVHTVLVAAEEPKIDKAILRVTDGKGAQIVIDPVGGSNTGRLLPGLVRGGTLVCIGYLAGKMTSIVIPYLVGWSRKLVGCDLFETPPDVVAGCIERLVAFGRAGKIRPRIDSTFRLEEYERAFRRVGSGTARGKVVLRLD